MAGEFSLDGALYVARPDKGVSDVLSRPVGNWPALVDDQTWLSVQKFI
jgi:hypothetical protein